MTEEELANYGQVTIHAIRKWTARRSHEHPLPCGHMGTLRRHHRKAVDQWMWDEDEHERLKRRERPASSEFEKSLSNHVGDAIMPML